MMDFPLTLPTLLERADKLFSSCRNRLSRPDRSLVRTCYGNFYRRARQLASALTKLGLRSGDRVASMMWNHSGHLEAFFGVPCAGRHLAHSEFEAPFTRIAAIAKSRCRRFLLIDDVLLPVYEKCRQNVPFEQVIVVSYGGCDEIPQGFLNYEQLLAEADNFQYPSSMKTTRRYVLHSGTTGFSKGVILLAPRHCSAFLC